MIYVMACDSCKKNMQILKANGIGSAFKAAKKTPWKRNSNNTVHQCPECMAKVKTELKPAKKDDPVTAGDISKDGK